MFTKNLQTETPAGNAVTPAAVTKDDPAPATADGTKAVEVQPGSQGDADIHWTVKGGVLEPAIWFSLGAIFFAATRYANRRRSGRAIRSATLEGPYTTVGETIYTPSGMINPATGQEFIDQRVRNYESSIALGDIFHRDISAELLGYIVKAKKRCTKKNPIVFSFLDEVVPPAKLEAVKHMVSTQWVNFFSARLTDMRSLYSRPLNHREFRDERDIVPMLIFEPHAEIKMFRVILLTPDQIKRGCLPNPEDLRCEFGRNDFRQGAGHRQEGRIQTHINMSRILEQPEHQWILNRTTVRVPTGNIKAIPPCATVCALA